jgi:hypothetical protein
LRLLPLLPPLELPRIRFIGSVLSGTLSARFLELPGVVLGCESTWFWIDVPKT